MPGEGRFYHKHIYLKIENATLERHFAQAPRNLLTQWQDDTHTNLYQLCERITRSGNRKRKPTAGQ